MDPSLDARRLLRIDEARAISRSGLQNDLRMCPLIVAFYEILGTDFGTVSRSLTPDRKSFFNHVSVFPLLVPETVFQVRKRDLFFP